MTIHRKVLLVSGAPCSGKTFLIENKLNDSEFIRLINLPPNYTVVNANSIRSGNFYDDKNKNLVVHYDCMRSYKRGHTISSKNDCFLQFLEDENDVYVLIVNTEVHVLRQRLKERMNRLANLITFQRQIKLNKLMSLYENSEFYLTELNKWFDFCLNNFNHYQIFTLKNIDTNFQVETLGNHRFG